MTQTVLDAFVVTVGIDSTAYKEGQKEVDKLQQQTIKDVQQTSKEATIAERKKAFDTARIQKRAEADKLRQERLNRASAQKARKQEEKETVESAESIQSKVFSVVKSAAGLALGFEGIRGLIGFIGEINQTTAELGRTAANLDLSSHEVNRVGNAVALAGGKAEDAQSAFGALSQSVTNLNTGKGFSDLLLLLQRQGVSYKDQTTGKLRNEADVYEDLANKVSKYDRATAHNYLANAGLSEGFINYLLMEKNARKELNDEAERTNAISAESVARSQKAQKNWRDFKLDIRGGVGAVWDKILTGDLSIAPATRRPELQDSWDSPAGIRGQTTNNPGNLKTVGGGEFRSFPTREKGIQAASHQLDLYERRGINTIQDIVKTYEGKDAPGNHNDVEGYTKDVVTRTGIGADKQLKPEDRANVLRAMFIHEDSDNRDISLEQIHSAITPTVFGDTNQIMPTPSVSNSNTDASSSRSTVYNVDIGHIGVHTAATDSSGIASSIGGAIQQKNILTTSQADYGQQ